MIPQFSLLTPSHSYAPVFKHFSQSCEIGYFSTNPGFKLTSSASPMRSHSQWTDELIDGHQEARAGTRLVVGGVGTSETCSDTHGERCSLRQYIIELCFHLFINGVHVYTRI